MRKFGLFVFLIFGLSLVHAQAKKSKKRVSSVAVNGSITQTSNWCGGARPTEEMEREFRTPKPFDNCTLYVRKDSNQLTKPILHTLTTDARGKFQLRLSPGKYVVVDILKKNDSVYQSTIHKYKEATQTTGPIDISCYNNFVALPDFTIIVPKNATKSVNVSHNYHQHCNWSGAPCVEFRGPYPP